MCIHCATKIPNCVSESCVTEIQPLIARLCFQGTPGEHKPALELGFWQAGGVCPCSLTGSDPSVQRGAVAPPRACSVAAPSSHLPTLHITLPARVSGVPFCTQLQSDTDSSSRAVRAAAVRAADNTPSHGHGYQQCAATFSRVSMVKMQGLQSCWKTHHSGMMQLTKTKR